jgi:ADP-heptose:LPS heptosyltransferase
MTKILLIKRGALGDILMATPLIRQLKQKVPNAKLDFLVSDQFAGVIKHNPYIDKLFTVSTETFSIKKIFALLKLALTFRGKYDYVFILDKHYYFNFIGRIISKNTVGYVREYTSWFFLRNYIKYNDVMRYHGLYYLDLLKASKLALPDYTDCKLDFNISITDNAKVQKTLHEYGLTTNEFLIIINSGGNNQFESGGARMLPENKVIGLINRLCQNPSIKIVLLGGLNDEINYNSYLKLIQTGSQLPQSRDRVINLAGKLSLEQSAALMICAKKIYTTDCGAMHIAISQSLYNKLYCFFGPTCPDHVLPPKMSIKYYWQDLEVFDKRYPLYGVVPKNKIYFTKFDPVIHK